MFVNTKGTNKDEVPVELVHFLQYVENSTEDCVKELADDVVRHLHERVERIKESREWERRYMRFEELLQDEREEGRGSAESRMLTLIARMTEAGEADKLSMLTDRAFLEEMYRKYEL